MGSNKVHAIALGLTAKSSTAPILFLSTIIIPKYSPQEQEDLITQGSHFRDDNWIFLGNQIALPKQQAYSLSMDIHNCLHIGPKSLLWFL